MSSKIKIPKLKHLQIKNRKTIPLFTVKNGNRLFHQKTLSKTCLQMDRGPRGNETLKIKKVFFFILG
jgi:hypothetical protein